MCKEKIIFDKTRGKRYTKTYMKEYFYKVIIEPQEEGGFTAYVPKLPGCVSEGDTYEETLKNIHEAMELYLEVLQERKKTIIEDDTHIAEMCIKL